MLGRSRGGFSTKLHARCDACGLPLGFVLTPGQAHDIQGFGPLFRMIEGRVWMLLADRSHDADAVRAEITFTGARAVIPVKRSRRSPALHSQPHYTWRNRIERMFNKLKNWRRVATRYDKTAASYLGFVWIASAFLWINFVHERWSKEFLEAGKRRLAGDTARAATTDESRACARKRALKEVVAEQTIELGLLKKSMVGDGERPE